MKNGFSKKFHNDMGSSLTAQRGDTINTHHEPKGEREIWPCRPGMYLVLLEC